MSKKYIIEIEEEPVTKDGVELWKACGFNALVFDQTGLDKLTPTITSLDHEIIYCRECKFWQDQEDGVVEVPICARPENKYEKNPFRFIVGADGFCSFAKRKDNV